MALGEKKIRLGVEDEKLNKLRQSVTELGNDLIRSSRQYTTSSKETLRDLEEQIRLIEKRNKLEREASEMSVRQGVQAGAVSPEAAKSRMSEIRTASKEDMLQVQLLRELIDTIKSTAKEEIRQDRGNVEKQIRADRSLDRLGITGDPEEALKRTIQRGMLGDISEEEVAERGRFSGRGAASAFNTTAGIATSKNEFYMAAAALSVIPMIGQGLGNVANRLFSSAEKAEASIGQLAGANMGRTYGEASSIFRGYAARDFGESMGLNASEVMSRRSDLQKTLGRGIIGDELGQALGAEKYVGAQNVSQVAGISRYGGGNIGDILGILEANNRNITTLTENISTFTTAAQNSIAISSNVNSEQIAKSVIGIQRATGQSGIGLSQVTGAIQGLGRTGNPVTRSLMMRAFRQANPNASMFDLQAMMEDPMSALGQGQGTSEFFGNLKGLTDGGQAYNQALYSVFGGQLSRSRIRDILSGGGDFTDIAKEIDSTKRGSFDFKKGAEGITGATARSTASIENMAQDYGLSLVNTTERISSEMKDAFQMISGYFSEDKETRKAAQDLAIKNFAKTNESMQKIIIWLSKIYNKG